MNFRTLQNNPVDASIAPYIAIVCNDAHATINSIYRGKDAEWLLHRHGKHSQAELYQQFLNGQGNPANPPGFSTHELRSDGVSYPNVQRGRSLAWWQQGFDVNDSDVDNVIRQARWHHWQLFRPYPSGSEFHHLNFRARPWPTPHTLARIIRLRLTLPRS